jgi:hypothetical protein
MTFEWRTTSTTGNRTISIDGYRSVLYSEGEGDKKAYGFAIAYGQGPSKYWNDYATAKEAQAAAEAELKRLLRLLEIAHIERWKRKNNLT